MSWELAAALGVVAVAAFGIGFKTAIELAELRRRWERDSRMLWDELRQHKVTIGLLLQEQEKQDRQLTAEKAFTRILYGRIESLHTRLMELLQEKTSC